MTFERRRFKEVLSLQMNYREDRKSSLNDQLDLTICLCVCLQFILSWSGHGSYNYESRQVIPLKIILRAIGVLEWLR